MHRNNARSEEEHDGEEGYLFVFNFFLVFACACTECGILLPRPGFKPEPLALELQS